MVKTLGASSSFRVVQSRARQIDSSLNVTGIDSLSGAIERRREWLASRRIEVVEEVRKEAATLMARSTEVARTVARDQTRRLAEVEDEVQRAVAHAVDLRGREAGFLMRAINHTRAFLRVHGAKRSVRKVQAETRAMEQSAGEFRETALRFEAEPFQEADRRLVHHAKILRELEALLDSPEARGSAGELAVAAELLQLPNDYWALHDVRLRAKTFLRFDGKAVQSAQVDHLVVGPTGVFVIETKSWSQKSASSGAYLDPYQQVGRAGLLCHCLLKDAGLPNRVRTIIASHQRIPESRHRGYTEIMPPDCVARFVGTRQRVMSKPDVEQVVAFVRECLGTN